MPDGTETPQGQEPNGSTATPESGSGRSIENFSDEAQDYIRRLRQENASHRNDRKALEAKLTEFENKNKSDDERRAEALTTAEGRATAAEAELARFRAAAAKGLPLKYADRLRGSTKEELETDAENLMKDFGLNESDAGRPGFDGGVRRPVNRPKTMNGLIREATRR